VILMHRAIGLGQWRHTYAHRAMGTPSRLPSTVRVPTRRIWNGHRHGWCIGLRP
jgi:hypothetical protein